MNQEVMPCIFFLYKTLNICASVFGRENIIVKPFEKSQFKEGLVKDFFIDVLNIPPDKLTDLKEKHVNERMSRDVLEYVNELEERPKYCDASALVEISQKLGDVNRYQDYFTREERLRLLEHHREGNEKIAREYLGREDGRLFYEEVSDKESEPYPGLTEDKRAMIDEEFRQLKCAYIRTCAENRKLANRVKRLFFDTKFRVENAVFQENHNRLVKTIRLFALMMLIITKRIAGGIARKVVRHTIGKILRWN